MKLPKNGSIRMRTIVNRLPLPFPLLYYCLHPFASRSISLSMYMGYMYIPFPFMTGTFYTKGAGLCTLQSPFSFLLSPLKKILYEHTLKGGADIW
jgi:hypothetical protein